MPNKFTEILEGYIESGVIAEVEIHANIKGKYPACKGCKSMHGRVLNVLDALDDSPLPSSSCTNELCRCVYLPVITEP